MFCNENDFGYNFSTFRTLQQNGVIKRKNRTLKEIARTMLCENNLPKCFWGKAINIACYVINMVSIRLLITKTPYELYKGRKTKCFTFEKFWL